MIDLTPVAIAEFITGLFFWWVAIYLFCQNPVNRFVQIVSAILASLSLYLSTDLLIFVAKETRQYALMGDVLRYMSWVMYLPVPLLFQACYNLLPLNKRDFWSKSLLIISYVFIVGLIVLDLSTSYIKDYSVFTSSDFSGEIWESAGRYFGVSMVLFSLIFLFVFITFIRALSCQKRFSREWYKLFWPTIGLGLTVILAPFTILSYYNTISYSPMYSILEIVFTSVPLCYSVLRYGLFLEDIKLVFGREFYQSTFVTLVVTLISYTATLLVRGDINPFSYWLFVTVILYIIIASSPLYVWLATFVRDLFNRRPGGFSVVNDQEVYDAVRHYRQPEILERCSLLRLKLVEQSKATPVDALRMLIKESIDYYKPEEDDRRTKQSIKYKLLRMITYDQAEEGQILWELGFEDYPVRIMTKETKSRLPELRAKSPSDYSYTSRNAFLALKKEAIHDLVWRVSYLEKQIAR